MIYLRLFWSFFQIGLFSIGGGYATIPLISQQVVELNAWLSKTQLSDIITISQMTPGPIAINSATFVGIQIAGIPGALAATVGCVFPSCLIVLFLAWAYYHYRNLKLIQGILSGLRPAVVALIASAGISLLVSSFWNNLPPSYSSTDFVAVILFLAALFSLKKWKLNPILVMTTAGAVGLILYPLSRGLFL